MSTLSNFDYAWSAVYQAVIKKDDLYFFSKAPDDLFCSIFDELDKAKHPMMVIIAANQHSVKTEFLRLIRERKENNQLPLLEVQQSNESYSQRIIDQIKRNFPNACKSRFKRTRLKHGVVQTEIEFPTKTKNAS